MLPSDLLLRGELSRCQNDWVGVGSEETDATTAAASAYAFTSVHKALEEGLLLNHHPTDELVHAEQSVPCFILPSPLPSSPNLLFETGPTTTANSVQLPEMTLPFTPQEHMQGLTNTDKHDFGSSQAEIPITESTAGMQQGTTSFAAVGTTTTSQLTETEFHIESLSEEAPGIWTEDPDLFSHSRAYESGTPEWDDEVSATPASTDHSDSVWLPPRAEQTDSSRMHSRVSSVFGEIAMPFAVGVDIRHPPIDASGSGCVETGPAPASKEGRMWHESKTNTTTSSLVPRPQSYSYNTPVLPSTQPLVSFPTRNNENIAAAAQQHLPPAPAQVQRSESSQHVASTPYQQRPPPIQYTRQDNYFVNQQQPMMNSNQRFHSNYYPNTHHHNIAPNETPYDTYQHPSKPSMSLLNKPSLPLLKCSCAWRCCELVSVAEREWITSTFSALHTDAQDEYLQGLMMIEDRRSKQKPQGEDQDNSPPGVDDDAQAGSKRKLCPSLDDDEITKRQRSCESDSTPPSRNSPSSTTTRPRKSFNTRFYCRVPAQLGSAATHSHVIPDPSHSTTFDSPTAIGRGLPRDPSLKYIRVCHSTFLALYQVSKKRVHKCALLAVQQPNKASATF